MRSLLVVIVDEGIELGLLLQEVFPRRFSGFFLQGQVHAFVPTVLLWITRLDTLDAGTSHKAYFSVIVPLGVMVIGS